MIDKSRLTVLCGAVLLFAALAIGGEQNEPQTTAEESFLRLRKSAAGEPIALETAIASYAPQGPSQRLTVDLVGAVHIADKSYYEQLNKTFKTYDVVLYELVAPPNTKPRPGQRSISSVSFLQLTMKNLLNLEFQLDRIKYDRPNFVHADMTPEEFSKTMAQRGESFSQMFLRMLGQSIAMQSKDPGRSGDAQLLAALFSAREQRAARLKRVMAEQFQDIEAATSILDGPDGSTILTERNKAALCVLAEQIKAGKARIAIFYGAAHLPDMEERLVKEFHLKKTGTRWLSAWDLKASGTPASKE